MFGMYYSPLPPEQLYWINDTVRTLSNNVMSANGSSLFYLYNLKDVNSTLSYTAGKVLRADGTKFNSANLSYSDLTGSPSITALQATGTAGENLVLGECCKIDSGGTVLKADNTTSEDVDKIIGLVSADTDSGDPVTLITHGKIENILWTWTTGTPVYLSTGGALTQTEPISGDIIVIGNPLSATELLVNPIKQGGSGSGGGMVLVPTATENNFASFDSAGQVKDSGSSASSFENAGAVSGHEGAYDHTLIETALQSETDPVYSAWDKSTGISITESQISDLEA